MSLSLNDQKKLWKHNNKEKVSLSGKKYYQANKEKINARSTIWWKNHPEQHANKQAARRARKRKAMPKWLTQKQLDHIKTYYAAARMFTLEFGMQMDVDHIIPLKGKDVCGLHVPWNMQIMEHITNTAKGNR